MGSYRGIIATVIGSLLLAPVVNAGEADVVTAASKECPLGPVTENDTVSKERAAKKAIDYYAKLGIPTRNLEPQTPLSVTTPSLQGSRNVALILRSGVGGIGIPAWVASNLKNRFNDTNFLLLTHHKELKIINENGNNYLVVDGANFFDSSGNLTYRKFDNSVQIHALDLSAIPESLRSEYETLSSPLNPLRLTQTFNNKATEAEKLQRNGVNFPRTKVIPKNTRKGEIHNIISTMFDKDGVFIKPVYGSQGRGIRGFLKYEDSMLYIQELLNSGTDVIIQERLVALPWIKAGKTYDWNLRVLATTNSDGIPYFSPDTIEVRYQELNPGNIFDPVNKSFKAEVLTLRQFMEDVSNPLSNSSYPITMMQFMENIRSLLQAGNNAFYVEGGDYPGFVGWDLIRTSDGIFVIESNTLRPGGAQTIQKIQDDYLSGASGVPLAEKLQNLAHSFDGPLLSNVPSWPGKQGEQPTAYDQNSTVTFMDKFQNGLLKELAEAAPSLSLREDSSERTNKPVKIIKNDNSQTLSNYNFNDVPIRFQRSIIVSVLETLLKDTYLDYGEMDRFNNNKILRKNVLLIYFSSNVSFEFSIGEKGDLFVASNLNVTSQDGGFNSIYKFFENNPDLYNLVYQYVLRNSVEGDRTATINISDWD